MKTIKTLVLTKRTRPPVSIRQCLEAAIFLEPQFVTPVYSEMAITALLSKEKPGIIVLDGEYGPKDRELWASMSNMNQSELRMLLSHPQSVLPTSLKMLQLIHALKEDSTTVVIFIDGPSDTVRTELIRLGASFVWPTLNRLSKYESSFYQIVFGAKTLGEGVVAMAKSVYEISTK